MKYGILIYNKEDYEKNKWFADSIVKNDYNLDITLIFSEDLEFFIEGNEFLIKENYKKIDFVINRSRDFYISNHFEKMGIKTYNSSKVTRIFNDKALSHQEINSLGIKSVKTYIKNIRKFNKSKYLDFPYVMKSTSGHGGTSVFLIENSSDFDEKIHKIDSEYFILQKLSKNIGKDVRVYILNNKIYASILRINENDFKSNFTLGGRCEIYNLNEKEKSIINKILEFNKFDFVGIDFIFDENNEFLFNEIEDVVGCRMLYQHNFDILNEFLIFISTESF